MRKKTSKLLSIAAALMMLAIPVSAQTVKSSTPPMQAVTQAEGISPRYTNIRTATPLVSKSYVGGILYAQRSMKLSITAKAYRGSKLLDTFSASTTGTSLDFEEEASLKTGDVVKFVFNAGGETQSTSVTVS